MEENIPLANILNFFLDAKADNFLSIPTRCENCGISPGEFSVFGILHFSPYRRSFQVFHDLVICSILYKLAYLHKMTLWPLVLSVGLV